MALGSTVLTVGFADLCGYTRMALALDDEGLGELLDRFEWLCEMAVAGRDARIVKLLGDGVLIAGCPTAVVAACIAIVRGAGDDDMLPAARAGVSSGRVLVRRGDCHGPVVNRARRIADTADPGSVRVDGTVETAARAAPRSEITMAPSVRLAHLEDLGPATLWELALAPAVPAHR